MDNNRAKTISCRKPFCYNDIINYIKNHNKNITKTKTKTRTIYQKIIQEGSKQYTKAEETQWKNKYHIYNLKIYGRALLNPTDNLLSNQRPLLQTTALFNKNEQLHAQMLQRQ